MVVPLCLRARWGRGRARDMTARQAAGASDLPPNRFLATILGHSTARASRADGGARHVMADTPLVTTITQVGIVVRDLDRALAEYTQKLGVGPWRVYTYAPPKLTGMRIRGVETSYSMKLALAWTGTMMWEL